MTSRTRPSFWRCHGRLPEDVKEQARQAYRLFMKDPGHPSLRFKKLEGQINVWSVRVSGRYRAVGVRAGELIEWVWIGSHSDFGNLFS